jgi:putative ABC transport system permease protein
MLRNYFLTALAVLRRRKFFTFISLFGISFTLTILIVVTAFVDHSISASYPDTQRSRSLYVNFVQLMDTKNNGRRNGPASFYFLNHYAGSLKTPAKLAISSTFTATNTYINNKKLLINIKYTNDAYWQVLQYQFTEGKPYSAQQIANAEKVAVITEDTRLKYFGNTPAVGKYIETDNVQYRISGVVKNVPVTQIFAYADMYVPYTVSKMNYKDKSIHGNYTGILLTDSKADVDKISKEYDQLMAKIPKSDFQGFDKLISKADPYLTSFTRNMFGNGTDTGIGDLLLAAGIFVFIFMLLPTLNLVNVNISRIMERSSEIGVRKAFGASSKTLVGQFLVENLILTFLGGAIGILLSYVILRVINASALIPDAALTINLKVLFYSLVACLVFGLFSGVYPAWRMSRLHVVTALKAS